jgi:PAS domain S-box-containing protein
VGEGAPRAAEPFDILKKRTGLDQSGELASALARRTTFGSLRVAWPRQSREATSHEAIVVVLSGAPLFDRHRQFLGYRGFGVVTGERAAVESGQFVHEDHQAEVAAIAAARPPTDLPPIRAETMDGGFVAGKAEVSAEAPSDMPSPSSSRPADQTRQGDGALSPDHALAASPAPAERGAEIVPLRAPGASFAGGPNVVPIRPGALRRFLSSDEGARLSSDEGARRGDDDESVELTTHERDAFREIARALGAKIRDHRENRAEPASHTPDEAGAPTEQTGDASDLTSPDPQATPLPAGAAQASGRPAIDAVTASAEPGARNESALLDQLPIGALVARGGEALYLNRTLLDLLGYRDLAQFRAKSGLNEILDGTQIERIALSGADEALSLTLADGETIAIDGKIQAIDWNGEPATLISVRRPIDTALAARMRALELEAQKRDNEARELSAVLDTATDGVAMLDSQGRILSLNRPGQALFGFDQADVVGEDFLKLIAPESHEAVKAYFEGLRTNGLANLLNDGREAVGRERHGRAIPLFITLGAINPSHDAKYCAVLRDMTQWKTIEGDLEQARGQAEKASALKSEFLAKISHEIRTPLNAILGFAEVIMDERFGPIGNDRYRVYLKDIHASGAHVMSLINDLLDLSKIEAGRLDLKFATVDANSVIQECVSLMQPQAAQERVIMRLSLFDKLPPIIADERSLRQIMLNLMSNAVKFNEPGGQVIVSTAMNDSGQAVIRVRDTGIGMSDAEIGMALEPFRRISTARPTDGTGLGLPLTKALAEANRAGFSIKSRKEQGTLVELAFPVAHAAAAQ